MSNLKVRRIAFDLEGTDFIWNKDNPSFSVTMNKVSFFAIGFEKYICQAMRDAEPLMKDPLIAEEARDFRSQESIHSNAHRKHVKALIAQHPGLQKALDDSIALYDKLYAEQDLKYHMAYTAGLESIFTPSFRLMLDNREKVFAKGDARVGSLFLWHFCEEIEHRSSALVVYDHIYGDYWYRIKRFKGFMAHVGVVIKAITDVFREVFPDMPEDYFNDSWGKQMPRIGKWRSALGITMSQMPWHNPDHQTLPEYFAEWSGRYDRGEDMTRVYGVGAQHGPAKVASAA